MKRFRPYLIVAALAVSLAFILRAAGSSLDLLPRIHSVEPLPLAGALILTVLATLGLGLTWIAILKALQPEVASLRALRFFVVTWPLRYVPGTLPYHALRVLMADTLATTRAVVAASIAYESILMLSSATAVGFAGVIIALGADASLGSAYLLLLLPLLTVPFFLQPRVLVPIANRALSVVHRSPITPDDVLTTPQALTSFARYAAIHCLNGLAFYLTLIAVTDSTIEPALAVGAFSLAAASGVAVIIVPSGLGVKEGVVVALLSSVIPPEQALLAAAAARGLSIVADLVPLLLLGLGDLVVRLVRLVARPGVAAGVASAGHESLQPHRPQTPR